MESDPIREFVSEMEKCLHLFRPPQPRRVRMYVDTSLGTHMMVSASPDALFSEIVDNFAECHLRNLPEYGHVSVTRMELIIDGQLYNCYGGYYLWELPEQPRVWADLVRVGENIIAEINVPPRDDNEVDPIVHVSNDHDEEVGDEERFDASIESDLGSLHVQESAQVNNDDGKVVVSNVSSELEDPQGCNIEVELPACLKRCGITTSEECQVMASQEQDRSCLLEKIPHGNIDSDNYNGVGSSTGQAFSSDYPRLMNEDDSAHGKKRWTPSTSHLGNIAKLARQKYEDTCRKRLFSAFEFQ